MSGTGVRNLASFCSQSSSVSTKSPFSMEQALAAHEVQKVKPMDSEVFVPILKVSMSYWKQKGKKGVWFKLPIELANLFEAAFKEGFMYQHAEPKYLMLVYLIPKDTRALPVNEGVVVAFKVDLQCHCCYMKVEKFIGKFSQIRDQVHNEKDGMAMIKFVCCKGDKSIKSIRTKEPGKTNEEENDEERSSIRRVVARSDQDKRPPPPPTVSNSPFPEGRPSYQYHHIDIPTTLLSYVEHAIYDSYDKEDDKNGT